MNRLCLICDQPASRICIHPNCDRIPFVCGKDCKHGYNLAVLAHTHNSSTKFAHYTDIQGKIDEIKSSIPLRDYVDQIKKRFLRVIGELNDIVDKFEKEFGSRQMKLKESVRNTIDMFDNKDRTNSMQGKHLDEVLDTYSVWDSYHPEQYAIETGKKEMEDMLRVLENMNFKILINPNLTAEQILQKKTYQDNERNKVFQYGFHIQDELNNHYKKEPQTYQKQVVKKTIKKN